LGGEAEGSWAAEHAGSSITLPGARATVRSAGSGNRDKRGKRLVFTLSANVIANHGQTLMFKITPVVCDYAKGYSGDEYS